MLDFISMCSAEQFGTERDRKIKKKRCLLRDLNQPHAIPQQVNQRFRQLDHTGEISSEVFIVQQYPDL